MARSWGTDVSGTRVFFEYGTVQPWSPGSPPRREAERDAAETGAVADQCGAIHAVGLSRGARALVGVLADDTTRFDRIVLVWPPGGASAGRYREWLAELPLIATTPLTSGNILILAARGDPGHPVKVAEQWASQLGAQLELFPANHRLPNILETMRKSCRDFLNP